MAGLTYRPSPTLLAGVSDEDAELATGALRPSNGSYQLTISKECRAVLEKKPGERSDQDVQTLLALTQSLRSFDNFSEYVVAELCRILVYEKIEGGVVLFEQGDVGTCWYTLLRGSVSVNVREPNGQNALTVCSLHAGDSFGELALVKNVPRAASVTTREQCEVLIVHKADYERILKYTHEKDLHEKVEFLHHVSVFRSWPRATLSQLSDVLSTKKFLPNKVIIHQGDEPEGVYFIKRGECMVIKEVEFRVRSAYRPGQEDATQIVSRLLQVATLGPGDYFGERSILLYSKRAASVVSATKVEVVMLSKLDFLRRVQGKTLQLMRDYARKYPTDAEIRRAFYDHKSWTDYKKKLVDEVISRKRAERAMRYG